MKKKHEERLRAAEVRRQQGEMEVDKVVPEVEAEVGLVAGPHIETKCARSGFTVLRTLTIKNRALWKAEDGRVCNPCHQLNCSCIWRQDN